MTTILKSITEEGFQKCFEQWIQCLPKCAAAWWDNLRGDSDYDITLSDNYRQPVHTDQLRYTHDHSLATFPTVYRRAYQSSCSCSDTCAKYSHHKKCHVNSTNNLQICY